MIEFESAFDVVLFIIEIIGCISFATSGTFTAIRKKADILGIWILTLIETFGGGMLRDIFMNKTAPKILWATDFLWLALIVIIISFLWFLIARNRKTAHFIDEHRHDRWIYYLDAVGIAVFSVVGCISAYDYIPDEAGEIGRYVYVIVIGVITGVGGGMFRDVFIGQIPSAFTKHFYVTPCILGCFVFMVMYDNGLSQISSSIVCLLIIIILRVLAIKFEWNLPTATGYNELAEARENNKQ